MSTVLKIRRGDQLTRSCAYTTDAGTAVNMTGYAVAASIITPYGTTIALTTQITNAAGGLFTIAAEESVTSQIPAGAVSTLKIVFTQPGGDLVSESCLVEGL
jgi:hypothetical protein